MKKYFLLCVAFLPFLLNSCTEAAGRREEQAGKGSFSFDGETYPISSSFASVDEVRKKLYITLSGHESKGRLPKLIISIEEFSGDGEYEFSETVQLNSSVTEDTRKWDSEGCTGKVKIRTIESGEIVGVVEGYLTTPYEDSFIPTRIRSSFQGLKLLPISSAEAFGTK